MKIKVRILVVDDMEKKRAHVIQKIRLASKAYEVEVFEASDYLSAKEELKSRQLDFIVLDLRLPAGHVEASEKWSRALMSDIVDRSLCFPMHVFGLTEYEDLADSERHYFEENMFGLFVFRWDSDEWAKSICRKIQYLVSAVANGTSYRFNSYDYDVLILVARYANEFVPIQKELFGPKGGERHALFNSEGSHFGRLLLENKKTLKSALLCVGETGLSPTAAVTSQAINILRPRLVVMLGMCAGFRAKKVRLLDVIFARESACWQEGKTFDQSSRDAFDPRGRLRSASNRVGNAIDRTFEMFAAQYDSLLAKQTETVEYKHLHEKFGDMVSFPAPTIKSGMLVSGSAVVASDTTREEVIRRFPTAVGVEMEIYSVYTASDLAMGLKPEYIALKGVADFADGEKRDDAQCYASKLDTSKNLAISDLM